MSPPAPPWASRSRDWKECTSSPAHRDHRGARAQSPGTGVSPKPSNDLTGRRSTRRKTPAEGTRTLDLLHGSDTASGVNRRKNPGNCPKTLEIVRNQAESPRLKSG